MHDALHRDAECRLSFRLGRVQQHPQLLDAHRLRGDRLPPGSEFRGPRGRNLAAEEPARSDRAAVPGRQLRLPKFHTDGPAPNSTAGAELMTFREPEDIRSLSMAAEDLSLAP